MQFKIHEQLWQSLCIGTHITRTAGSNKFCEMIWKMGGCWVTQLHKGVFQADSKAQNKDLWSSQYVLLSPDHFLSSWPFFSSCPFLSSCPCFSSWPLISSRPFFSTWLPAILSSQPDLSSWDDLSFQANLVSPIDPSSPVVSKVVFYGQSDDLAVHKYNTGQMTHNAVMNWLGLVGRRWAGAQKDLGLILLWLSSLFNNCGLCTMKLWPEWSFRLSLKSHFFKLCRWLCVCVCVCMCKLLRPCFDFPFFAL